MNEEKKIHEVVTRISDVLKAAEKVKEEIEKEKEKK